MIPPFSSPFFRCPICRELLRRQENSLVCPHRHTFDISSGGSVNLSGAFGKKHGDNADMVKARRQFLISGAYAPMRAAVKDLLDRYVKEGVLLDSGCGEGYYSEAFVSEKRQVYGIDISPKAAMMCAKRRVLSGVAVASCYNLPVPDGICDAVTNIFSPFCREEFLRVLKTGGYVIDVIPAEKHLWELKSAIYDTPYENTIRPIGIEGFRHVTTEKVETRFTLHTHDEIRDLVLMTPYFYRTGKTGHERLSALTELSVSAEFYLLVYQKL
ncbi:MAG: methyltransferase domain-containing protein [Clostridia bacterium]|nr:methyltransferase domain-containing protein [Clostridia bacterium]